MNEIDILLVEDDPVTAIAEESELEKYDFNVETVHNSKDTLNYLKHNQDIDLILMDIELDDRRDGIETARIIESKYDLPILFLTAHSEPEYLKRTEATQSYNYLVKDDCSGPMLNNAIHQALKLHRVQQKLKQEREQYKKLVHTTREAMAIVKDGELYLVNPALANMLGYREEEVAGNSINEFELFSKVQEELVKLERNSKGAVEFEIQYNDNTGVKHYLRARIVEIQIQFEPAYILVFYDITRRKKLLKQINEDDEEETQGLTPICSSCKKIKEKSDLETIWQEPEDYITKQCPHIEFTHGICPECKKELLEGHLQDGSIDQN